MRNRVKNAVKVIYALLWLLIMIFPLALVVINAFKSRMEIIKNPVALPSSFSFHNFSVAFHTMKFPSAFLNTLYVTALSQIVLIVFSSMLAYMLLRWNWRINKIIFCVLVCSMVIPFQSLMISFVNLFGKIGMMNSKTALVFFYLGFGLPMSTFMYHGFIKGISKEIEESAIIDGCGRMSCFWRVVFPNLKSITTTILIMNILWIWNDFLLPSLVLIKADARTLPLSTFYFFGEYMAELGYAMAALVMSVLPVIIVYLFLQKQIVSGIMSGAIK